MDLGKKLKNAAKATGSGALIVSTALANSSVNSRIREIDEEIEKLTAEKETLQKRLI